VAVSNHPNVNNITDTTVESSSSNPKKRARPNDQSPLSEGCATSKEGIGSLEVQFDSQDRRYIVVSCAGRPGKLFLNKFYKLQGNKGFEKCIEYNSKLLAPQEFKSACGMKAMKAWEKSLKHKSLPLLDYINSGLLVEIDPSHLHSTDAPFNVAAAINSAFIDLESRLLSSIQDAMHSSLASFKSSFDSVLKDKVSELSDRIQHLESSVSSSQATTPAPNATLSAPQICL